MGPRRKRRVSPFLAAMKEAAREGFSEFILLALKKWPRPFICLCLVLVCNNVDNSGAPTPPAEFAHAPEPIQDFTTDAGVVLAVPPWLVAKLPPPDPRQNKPPCQTAIGEAAIGGHCWLRLTVPPPCPRKNHAYEHDDGHCYVAVLQPARMPSSGGGNPQPIAE
jgi:hypothetical protein